MWGGRLPPRFNTYLQLQPDSGCGWFGRVLRACSLRAAGRLGLRLWRCLLLLRLRLWFGCHSATGVGVKRRQHLLQIPRHFAALMSRVCVDHAAIVWNSSPMGLQSGEGRGAGKRGRCHKIKKLRSLFFWGFPPSPPPAAPAHSATSKNAEAHYTHVHERGRPSSGAGRQALRLLLQVHGEARLHNRCVQASCVAL